jgi:hypothetical protein
MTFVRSRFWEGRDGFEARLIDWRFWEGSIQWLGIEVRRKSEWIEDIIDYIREILRIWRDYEKYCFKRKKREYKFGGKNLAGLEIFTLAKKNDIWERF